MSFHKIYIYNKGKSRKDYNSRKSHLCKIEFQGKYFHKCIGLSCWISWGDYIFRFNEVSYFLGCQKNLEIVLDIPLVEITNEIIPKVQKPFEELLCDCQTFFENKDNYLKYHAFCCS